MLSDPAASAPRPTVDVDLLVNAKNLAEYQTRIRNQLIELGLKESVEPGDPICAWRLDGLRVDVMPSNTNILGFANTWSESAVATAKSVIIGDIVIRVIDSPHFVATKLEAFNSRGRRDCYASHDLEDIITVVDGRSELSDELDQAPLALQTYVRSEFEKLLSDPNFLNALPGHVEDDDREVVVLKRWERIAMRTR